LVVCGRIKFFSEVLLQNKSRKDEVAKVQRYEFVRVPRVESWQGNAEVVKKRLLRDARQLGIGRGGEG
jgi:hypothetical protein